MGWKLKSKIFGVNFNIDLETQLPFFENFYERKLGKIWTNKEFAERGASKVFITEALRFLPNGHFIILFFDSTGDYFVQLCNSGGDIILDFPMWKKSVVFGKEKEFIKILRSMTFRRKFWKSRGTRATPYTYYGYSEGKGKKGVEAIFGENYNLAADATLLIAEEIFGFDKTGIYNFDSSELIPKV